MTRSPHPSLLELDRLSLDPASASEAARLHAGTCQACSAHLSRLAAAVPIPAWVREPRPARRWNPIPLLAALAALTTGGVVALHLSASPRLPRAIDVEKGAGPGLNLYVKRGAEVVVWDGREPVHPGDSLRMEVAPERTSHLVVTTPGSPSPQILFEGEVSSEEPGFLPVSWRVDDSPGPEILDIRLTAPGVPPWHTRLTLAKAAGR